MTTSIRISSTIPGAPRTGFLGATIGGNEPGPSVDVVAETDDVENLNDVVNFIQDVAGSVSGAFIRITGQEPLIEAEVVDDEDDEPAPEQVFLSGQAFTPAQWEVVEQYVARKVAEATAVPEAVDDDFGLEDL